MTTEEKLRIAVAALLELAALNDGDANRHLEHTGSYAGFDEPNAVRVSRTALGELLMGPLQ